MDELNEKFASSCMAAKASCCKKGQLFIVEEEYQRIVEWLQANSPHELAEFEGRSQKHDGFRLYDQMSSCQFLDSNNLCRIHNEGVKPAECFWWPLHVYLNEDAAKFEIRASTTCCAASSCLPESSLLEGEIRTTCEGIGDDILLRFRAAYKGSYQTKYIADL